MVRHTLSSLVETQIKIHLRQSKLNEVGKEIGQNVIASFLPIFTH